MRPQQFSQDRGGFQGDSSQRPFTPAQSFQQSNYPHVRDNAPQSFPGSQQARVYALTEDQAREAPGGVIAGTCLINSYTARVLFDTGASHSFLASNFVVEYGFVTTPLHEVASVSTSAGKMIFIGAYCVELCMAFQ